MNRNLVYDKGDTSIHWGKDGLFNLISGAWISKLPLGKINKILSVVHTIHNKGSQWITYVM